MDLRNYSNLKTSLALSIRNALESKDAASDPLLDSIEWDISNIYPNKGLPEVTDPKRCSYRARIVIAGPDADTSLGEYVSTSIMSPRFVVSIFSRDNTASEYLLSSLKILVDDISLVRIDAFSASNYSNVFNCYVGEILLTLNLGSIPSSSGRSGRCNPPTAPDNNCGLLPAIDLDRDLTLREP